MGNTITRLNTAVVGIALVLGVPGVVALPTVSAQTTVNVAMTNLRFEPEAVTVNVGDTVLWTNVSAFAPHTASADEPDKPGSFNSGFFPWKWVFAGGKFQFTFTREGTYPYNCLLHKGLGMVGTITVRTTALSPRYFFTAAPIADKDQVVLEWNVAPDKLRAGFRILRSTGWDQEFVAISEPIKAKAESARGEEYQFLDTNKTDAGTEYFYVLEEVRLDGRPHFRGPAVAHAR